MQKSFRKFFSLFWVQFFGAFNDNFFKSFLVLLITYSNLSFLGMKSSTLIAFCGGLFILPFVLFSSFAGILADRYQKIQIVKIVKIVEALVMVLVALGYSFNSLLCLFFALFMLGVHSTFFGPIKYSLIPEYVDDQTLMRANVWVSTGTFLAILLGTITAGLLVSHQLMGVLIFMLNMFSWAGLYFAFKLEPVSLIDREIPLGESQWHMLKKVLKLSMKEKDIFALIIGISWFWLLGSALLTLIPLLAKNVFVGKESVATLFLAIFVLGMGVGPSVFERLSRGRVLSWFIPVSLLLTTLFIFDLALVANKTFAKTFIFSTPFVGASDLTGVSGGVRALIDLFFIAFFGGMYTVPQFTQLQRLADQRVLSRLIAANNIWNSIFMVGISLFLMILFSKGLALSQVIAVVGFLNLLMSLSLVYVYREDFNTFWKF